MLEKCSLLQGMSGRPQIVCQLQSASVAVCAEDAEPVSGSGKEGWERLGEAEAANEVHVTTPGLV